MIGTLLPEVQDHRTAVLILSLEADRLVRDGRPGAALQLVPAMLNVARGLDGEPFLISALVRFACDAVTARRAERTLALGVPTGGLAEVQAALLAEAEGDVFWGPFRGERACLDHLFTNLRTGVVPPNLVLSLADSSGSPPPAWKAVAMDWSYRLFAAHDHAAMLERLTAMCEVGRLPEHQRRAALKVVPPPPDGPGTQLTRLLLPHVEKVHDASLRHQAVLRSAGVAVACERFRQGRRGGGRTYWPSCRRTSCRPSRLTRSTASRSSTSGGPTGWRSTRSASTKRTTAGQSRKPGRRRRQEPGDVGPPFRLDQRGMPPADRSGNRPRARLCHRPGPNSGDRVPGGPPPPRSRRADGRRGSPGPFSRAGSETRASTFQGPPHRRPAKAPTSGM